MGGEFSPSDGIYICWASFLDGLQRVLLFTEDRSIAEGAQASNVFSQFDQEINVSIHGLGLSLVNNSIRQEIMYIGIASSGKLPLFLSKIHAALSAKAARNDSISRGFVNS